MVLSVDGIVNKAGSGARIVFEGLDKVVVEQALKFNFRPTYNQAEYEALLVRMPLTWEMESRS